MRGVKTHTVGTPATGSLKTRCGTQPSTADSRTDAMGVPQGAEWDAHNDGDPDTYFPATDAGQLGVQLKRAFNEIIHRTASASSASVNSGRISDESRVYQAAFNSRGWTGDLLAFQIDPQNGSLSTNPEWRAASKLPAHYSRSIFTLDSTGNGIPFTWTAVGADATRVLQLDPNTGSPLAQATLEYLRGEAPTRATSPASSGRASSASWATSCPRRRCSSAGRRSATATISKGPAASLTRPSSPRNDTDAERTPMVYAGANDGMLHGFNANTGAEVFAFVPTPMFKLIGAGPLARITRLAQQNYVHEYFVDGPPSMGDAYWGGAWHTVVAGGLNKGGQGIYALDVTSTSRLAAAESTTNAPATILWELTDADDADLGYTFSQPSIVKTHDTSGGGTGRWVVAFGNGYNSTQTDGAASSTGNAVLFIRDAATGATVAKIDTGVGNARAPGGYGVGQRPVDARVRRHRRGSHRRLRIRRRSVGQHVEVRPARRESGQLEGRVRHRYRSARCSPQSTRRATGSRSPCAPRSRAARRAPAWSCSSAPASTSSLRTCCPRPCGRKASTGSSIATRAFPAPIA